MTSGRTALSLIHILCDGSTRGCALADIPDTVGFSRGDVKLGGRLAMASSLAEIFLLEYGQWPERNAGWGEVDAEALKTMLPLSLIHI